MKTKESYQTTFDKLDWVEFKKILKDMGYLNVLWHKCDIEDWINEHYPEFKYTNDDIDNIAYDVEHYFDAEYGVNWQTIENYVWEYIKNSNQSEILD